jgi:hypothetical protein
MVSRDPSHALESHIFARDRGDKIFHRAQIDRAVAVQDVEGQTETAGQPSKAALL